MEESGLVVLCNDLLEHDLAAGAIGTIVLVYGDGEAYEVEFIRGPLRRPALLTLTAEQIGPLAGSHIASASAAVPRT